MTDEPARASHEVTPFILLYVWRTGDMPATAAELSRVVGISPPITEEELVNCLKDPKAIEWLASQGVESSKSTLTNKQLRLIRELTDSTHAAPLHVRLKKAGVTHEQYNIWKRNKFFNNALMSESRRNLDDARALAISALSRNAASGDLKSIGFLLELTGDYTPNKREDRININVVQTELRQTVDKLIEILQEELSPEQLARVLYRFESTMAPAAAPAPIHTKQTLLELEPVSTSDLII